MKWRRHRPLLGGLAFSTSYGAAIYSLQRVFPFLLFGSDFLGFFRMIKFLEIRFMWFVLFLKVGGAYVWWKSQLQTWNPFLTSSQEAHISKWAFMTDISKSIMFEVLHRRPKFGLKSWLEKRQQKTIKKTSKTKSCFFEKINKMTDNEEWRRQRGNSQITKIRNEIGDIMTYLTEIDSKVIT